MPTGSGKSITILAEALMSNSRTLILTATKNLQDQYLETLKGIGIQDVRGQRNYSCLATFPGSEHYELGTPYSMVDEAPCKWGVGCSLMLGGCTYYDAVRKARQSKIVLANYDLHISMNRFSEGLGGFDLIVCDEGHEAGARVADNMAAELSDWELKHIVKATPPDSIDPMDWANWANIYKRNISLKIETILRGKIKAESSDKLKQLTKTKRTLEQMGCAEKDWIVQTGEGKHRIEPVWPRKFSEPYLFSGAKKVVFASATIRPKALEYHGLKPEDYDYFEYPSPFPIANRPVWYVPIVKMRYGMDFEDILRIIRAVDQLIARRLDKKIIIHCVSYNLQQIIIANSKFAHRMMANTKQDTKYVIERFKARQDPCILVTPSADTGVDLPGISCEVAIVVKVPFPTLSPVYRAREAEDAEYGPYVAATTLVQMAGRHVRHETDKGETIILDAAFGSVLARYPHLFPKWFLAAVRKSELLPNPLPKM